MPITDAREPARNYPIPSAGNDTADEFPRLVAALEMIGVDVAALIAALGGKAPVVHGHPISAIVDLASVLEGKAAVDHAHALDDLSDVAVAGAAAYQVLAKIAGAWQPWTVDLAHVSGTGVLRVDGPQVLTSTEKAQGRSNLAAAPLDSPEFTGTPKVPTVSIVADSFAVANVTMVRAAVAALVASSPSALDTLNELATALGNDPSFAATMTTALAGKQPRDATLTALAALATAADKLIYATGVDTFATSALSAYARTLLAAADAASARTILGSDNVVAIRNLVYAMTTTDYARSSGASGAGTYVTGSDLMEVDSTNTDTTVLFMATARIEVDADASNAGSVEVAMRLEYYNAGVWSAVPAVTGLVRIVGLTAGSGVIKANISCQGRLLQAHRYNTVLWRTRLAIAPTTAYTTVTVFDSAVTFIEQGGML